jgi:hypothetical protein
MKRDFVNVAGPDEQGISGVGGALIAVASALDDETQAIVASEVHGGGNLIGVARGDSVDARLGRPGIRPAHRLREAWCIADEERIAEIFPESFASRSLWPGFAGFEREVDCDEIAADLLLEVVPACGTGPRRITGSDAGLGLGERDVGLERRQKRQRSKVFEKSPPIYKGCTSRGVKMEGK